MGRIPNVRSKISGNNPGNREINKQDLARAYKIPLQKHTNFVSVGGFYLSKNPLFLIKKIAYRPLSMARFRPVEYHSAHVRKPPHTTFCNAYHQNSTRMDQKHNEVLPNNTGTDKRTSTAKPKNVKKH